MLFFIPITSTSPILLQMKVDGMDFTMIQLQQFMITIQHNNIFRCLLTLQYEITDEIIKCGIHSNTIICDSGDLHW